MLGRRTGHERSPLDYQSQSDRDTDNDTYGKDNVVALPKSHGKYKQKSGAEADKQDLDELIRNHAQPGTELEAGLKALIARDSLFDPSEFLVGAKTAYEMIVVAYSEGNKNSLKPLLSPDVYDGFVEEIDNRNERDEVMDSSFVGINKAVLMEAELKNNDALVTVKFVSEMIIAVRNTEGKILSGDPKKIIDVTDIWTFSRDVTSKDPNWKLIGTGTEN